jgi:hypothetical protein
MVAKTASQHDYSHITNVNGRKLFAFFQMSYDDPASTAYQLSCKHYSEVAVEQFCRLVSKRQQIMAQRRRRQLQLDSGITNCFEIETLMLDAMLEAKTTGEASLQLEPSMALIESFGELCRQANLLDDSGYFDDPHKLVMFFCKSPHL